MKNKIRLNGFLLTYIIFALVLAVLVASALVYVDSVLDEYEEKHPTRLLEKAVVLLQAEAENGTLYQKDEAPAMISGKFEENKNVKDEFAKKLSGDIKFSSQKWISETECTYNVLSDGFAIAEIKLKKIGEPITKLAIISIQEYELVSYLPISHTYTIELSKEIALSDEISVSVNGIELGESDLTKAEDGKIMMQELFGEFAPYAYYVPHILILSGVLVIWLLPERMWQIKPGIMFVFLAIATLYMFWYFGKIAEYKRNKKDENK